jgi:hypothetical protein
MKARIRTPDAPEGLPVPTDAAFLDRMEVLNLTTDFGDLDIQFKPAGVPGYEVLHQRALDYDLSGERVPTAYLGDVIRSKESAGRPKDHQMLPTLHRMRDMWKIAAQQGLATGQYLVNCSHCNYIAQTWEESDILLQIGSSCPHCRQVSYTASAGQNFEILADRIGRFAISESREDRTRVPALACDLVTQMFQTLASRGLSSHPEIQGLLDQSKPQPQKYLELIEKLGTAAPTQLHRLATLWSDMLALRDRIAAADDADPIVKVDDLERAVALVDTALESYRYLNNRYCLRG